MAAVAGSAAAGGARGQCGKRGASGAGDLPWPRSPARTCRCKRLWALGSTRISSRRWSSSCANTLILMSFNYSSLLRENHRPGPQPGLGRLRHTGPSSPAIPGWWHPCWGRWHLCQGPMAPLPGMGHLCQALVAPLPGMWHLCWGWDTSAGVQWHLYSVSSSREGLAGGPGLCCLLPLAPAAGAVPPEQGGRGKTRLLDVQWPFNCQPGNSIDVAF